MKRLLLIGLVVAAVYFGTREAEFVPEQQDARTSTSTGTSTSANSTANSTASTSATGTDQVLAAAFEQRQSDVQVQASGRVTRVLADDNDGSRHQRFIVQLASGQTVLVAHNIDLASRVASLQTGDVVEFYGEYEWNERGGVIHWTHRDPQHGHTDGWIRHNGHTYQ